MVTNNTKEEKLLEFLSQMSTHEEMVFLYETIQKIPISKIFTQNEQLLVREIIDIMHEAIFKKINKDHFENYLSLVATKCEESYKKNKLAPQLIEKTNKSRAVSYTLDAIYAAMEVIYHKKNEENCPINTMHTVSNIVIAFKLLYQRRAPQEEMDFFNECHKTAENILSSSEKHTETAEVIPFQKR